MSAPISAPTIYRMKSEGRPIVCLTAYDSTTGEIADASGADLVLVGDSVGNTMLGHPTTLFVDLGDMVRHTRAVATSVKSALLIADLPFGSYQSSVGQAVDSAVALMKAGAAGVKLEGLYQEAVEAIIRAGIPVMGHVGMTPQSYHQFGGFRVQGRDNAEGVLEAAARLDDSGVFSIVLELIPTDLARKITGEVKCPTIGIGAGPYCDGQIQVFHDVVGLTTHRFKHAKPYADAYGSFLKAAKSYTEEVRSKSFPSEENSF